jgi:hypothetical protein
VIPVPYRVPADVMTAHLKGEAVILHLGTKAYFQMNDTAAALWQGLEAGEDEAAIVARLTTAFQVAPEEARPEVRRIIGELLARGLLTE